MTGAACAGAPAADRLTCGVIDNLAALQDINPQWLGFLAERAGRHSAYAHPAFAEAELRLHPDYHPSMVVVRRGGQIEAIAPGFLHDTRAKLELSIRKIASFRARIWRLFGSEIVFAKGADRAACLRAVLTALNASRVGGDFAHLDCLEVENDTWVALHSGGLDETGYHLMPTSHALDTIRRIRFPGTYDEYFASLSHHTRSWMRRRQKKLTASGGLRLARCTTPDEVQNFIIGLDAVYNRSWQAHSFGPRPRARPEDGDYYGLLAAAGLLRGYVLWDGDLPLAFSVGYQHRKTYYYAETGYDMAVSNLAPGMVLQTLVFQDLLEHDPVSLLDFGPGDSQMKQSFANEEARACIAYLARRLPWRAFVRGQRLIGVVENGVRVGLKRVHADVFARNVLRRGVRSSPRANADEPDATADQSRSTPP
jgi:Acetyltransferase (GNAT) domain